MSIKLQRYTITALICLLTIACTTHKQPSPGKVRASYTMVSISSSNVHFSKGNSFAWHAKPRPVMGETKINITELTRLLDQSFEQALIKQGYIWNASAVGTQYQIRYIAIAGDAVSDADINKVFKLNPGLHVDQQQQGIYAKGTLIVDIVDSRTGQSVWQVAMQANLHHDQGIEARKLRIAQAVNTIIAKMP